MRESAAVIFLRDGYAGASVDDITQEARVSKATLYKYFPEKSIMFHAAMHAELDDAFRNSPFEKLRNGDAADILPAALTALADWAVARHRVRLLRIVTAEGIRFPQIAEAYEAAIATRIIIPLKELIDFWIEEGQINDHDSDHSARQLVAMVLGQVQTRSMLTSSGYTKEQLATCARAAADLFLCGHAIADHISV